MTIPARPGAITHLGPRPFAPGTRTPCFGRGDLFTPPEGARDLVERLRAARELCRSCPVIEACEQHAFSDPADAIGVRGGLSQQQRALTAARRRRRSNSAEPRKQAAA